MLDNSIHENHLLHPWTISYEPLLLNSNNCVLSNYTLNQQLDLVYGNKFAFTLLEQ